MRILITAPQPRRSWITIFPHASISDLKHEFRPVPAGDFEQVSIFTPKSQLGLSDSRTSPARSAGDGDYVRTSQPEFQSPWKGSALET